MIVLTVVGFNGAPASGPSASFDEHGGSIGRAEGNQLVLPDPERSISRQHARVLFRGGQYAIVDNGSNPIAVNGQPVPLGREQRLAPGDQVQIGGYVLLVAPGAAAAPADPFADLFGGAAPGLAAPVGPVPRASPFAPVAPPSTDPWATPVPWNSAPAAPTPVAAPPWSAAPAAGWPPPPPAPAWGTAPAAPPPVAAAGIPDDWDFLAPAPAPASPAGALPAAGLPVAAPGQDSLDDLFGLGGAPAAGDPLGAPQARALLLQPNTAGSADPLQALAAAPPTAAPASLADHASELHTPMPLPPMPLPPMARPAAPDAADTPRGAVFSWDDPPPDGRVVTLPGMPSPNAAWGAATAPQADTARTLVRAAGAAATAPGAAPVAPPAAPSSAATTASAPPAAPPYTAPAAWPPPASTAAAAPMAAAAAAPPGSGEAVLLAALLQGLATPGLRIDQLTPELMLRLGHLLRESTRGAVELLAARAALKREMRAPVTMIQGRENNPLKFSPTADAALLHLLGPAVAGFMPPAPAMRDAFDDLRAHQLGVLAGMKAAMDGMLQRFDPQQLEARLASRAGLAGLIPATRKARLWEAFQQLFGQLSAEAQEDVDALFGKAFLRAYQEQLDRLQAEPPAPG